MQSKQLLAQADELIELKKYEKYLKQKVEEKDKNTEKQQREFQEKKENQKTKHKEIIEGLRQQIYSLQMELQA